MRRAIRWGIPIAVVLLAVVYLGISYLIAAGVTRAERKEQEDHPANYGLRFEDVEFAARGGDVTLRGWYIPGQSQRPTLIFVHGIGGVRTGDNATDLASRLVGRGFNVLMFDLRAHGSSEGDKVSGGFHESRDVLGALDYLVQRGIPPDNVGIVAFSMGAGTSILALAGDASVRALVVDSTYANALELIAQETARKTIFPRWIVPLFVPGAELFASLLFDIDLGALAPEDAVTRLDFPILVIHGRDDTRIPVEHGVRVHMASHSESGLWLVSGVDHVDAFLTFPDEYVERVASYFDVQLGGE